MLLHPSVRRDDGLTTITEHLTARCRRRAGGALWPLESSRWRQVQIGKRREKCLSAASCFPFPICACRRREPPKGATNLRSPSFAYITWRSKKSERLPGRPRQGRPKKEKSKLPKQVKNSSTKQKSGPKRKPPSSTKQLKIKRAKPAAPAWESTPAK